ncbi:unnamed protein product [Urochloa humidicola]
MEGSSGAQGGGNSPAVGDVRRSPRIRAQPNAGNVDPKMMLKNRRQRLRLPSTPQPESKSDDSADNDFEADVAAEEEEADIEIDAPVHGNIRKRRRNQTRDDSHTSPGSSSTAADVPAARKIKKKPTLSIRCSPSKFRDLVNALDDDMKNAIRAKNFGGLLDFKPCELERKLLSWLMRKLNPDNMQLKLAGDQRISITQHSVWCVFQLPMDGGGPPEMTDVATHLRRRQLAAQFFGNELDKIGLGEIEKLFKARKLTGDIGLRAFFMCAFQCLLFSNTSCYLRLDDIKYTEDMENIGNMN